MTTTTEQRVRHTRSFPIDARAEAGARNGAQRIRIMTGARARDGDVIDPMGMSVDEYLRNPVVLWVHDAWGRSPSAGLPIGRTLALDRKTDGIDVEFEFLQGDSFAERVKNAWEQGFLRTASVSWQSMEVKPLADGRGLLHSRTSLLEWSLAPLPVDPGASRSRAHEEALRALGLAPIEDAMEEALERFVQAAGERLTPGPRET